MKKEENMRPAIRLELTQEPQQILECSMSLGGVEESEPRFSKNGWLPLGYGCSMKQIPAEQYYYNY